STAVRDKLPVIASDSLNAISRKPLAFEYIRRLKKNGQRGRAIEYVLIALLITLYCTSGVFRRWSKGHLTCAALGACLNSTPSNALPARALPARVAMPC